MKLLTKSIRDRMLTNGRLARELSKDGKSAPDFLPVVKLFTPDAGMTWLLTELDPEDHDIAFGLCDLSLGCPEIGRVRISEIATVRGKLGLPAERDRHFTPDKTLSAYAEQALACGCIKD